MDQQNKDNEDISFLSFFWMKVVKYWKILAGFIAAVIGLVILKNSRENKVLQNAREANKQELKVIRDTAALEKESKIIASQRFEKTLEKIEKDFNVRKAEISEEKRLAISDLISSSIDDPDAIAKELAKILSIDFVKRK